MGSVSYGTKRASTWDGESVNWGSWSARTGWDTVWTQINSDSPTLYTLYSVCYRINVSYGTSTHIKALTVGIPLGENGKEGWYDGQGVWHEGTRAIVRARLYAKDPTVGELSPDDFYYEQSIPQDILPFPNVTTIEYTWDSLVLIGKPTTLYLLIDVIYNALAPMYEGCTIYVVHSYNYVTYGYVSAVFGEPPKYTVTYDGNDTKGSIANLPSTETITYGDAISTKKPTNTYVIKLDANGGIASSTEVDSVRSFNSWNTERNGTGTKYSPGEAYIESGSKTLYAQWGNPTTVNLPVATRTGYDFLGWGATKDATILYNGTFTPTTPLTLFANWKRKGVVHIYSSADSKWHSYLVWVRNGDTGGPNNNGWHHAIPMVYSGSKFHTCG